jgi:hypothetical protein
VEHVVWKEEEKWHPELCWREILGSDIFEKKVAVE